MTKHLFDIKYFNNNKKESGLKNLDLYRDRILTVKAIRIYELDFSEIIVIPHFSHVLTHTIIIGVILFERNSFKDMCH